jgi:hypothetical protein
MTRTRILAPFSLLFLGNTAVLTSAALGLNETAAEVGVD